MSIYPHTRVNIPLTAQQFSDAQDLLLVELTLALETQLAPLGYVSLDCYKQAKTKDGKKIILLAKHKRSGDDPAILGLNAANQELMTVNIEKIRPQFAVNGEEHISLKQDSIGYPEGTIKKRIGFFSKSRFAEEKRVGHTSIRKFISTRIHELAPEAADTVTKVMSHFHQTARRSYVRSELTSVGASATNPNVRTSASGSSIVPPNTLQRQAKYYPNHTASTPL